MVASPWLELGSWLLLPLTLWLTSAGTSLALERGLRGPLPDALLVPIGFCATMAVALTGHTLGLPLWSVVAVVAVVAVAGLGLNGLRWRRLLAGWAGAAGLTTFVLYLSPVLLSGHWTWAGYNFVNDTAVQFLLTDWVKSGDAVPPVGVSTVGDTLHQYLATDYPLGSHSQLALLTDITRAPTAASYQAYISAAAGVGAMACQYVLTSVRARPWYAAVAAVTALAANLTLQYALQGNIKEIAFVATLLTAAAAGRHLLATERPAPAGAVFGVTVSACLAAYSGAALPYLAILCLLVVVAFLLRARAWRQRVVPALGAAVGATVLLSLPEAKSVLAFARNILGIYGPSTTGVAASARLQLGQLQAPLPWWQVGGIYLNGQYSTPLVTHATLTHVAVFALIALAVVGLGLAVLWRRWALLLAALPAIIALALGAPKVSPYAAGKMLAIASPVVVLAAASVPGLLGGRWRFVGLVLAAPLALAVFVSDVFAVHDVRLAPTRRMADLRDVGRRYPHTGLMLYPEFEEFAKYFAQGAQIDPVTESTPRHFVVLRHPEAFGGHTYDLDEQMTDFVEQYPYIVLRRGAAESRPPFNYRLDYVNPSYAVWRRVAGPTVLDHLPLGNFYAPASRPACHTVMSFARKAPTGTMLAAAAAPEDDQFNVRYGSQSVSAGWFVDPFAPWLVRMPTPGSASGTTRVLGGTYRIWVMGSFGRRLLVEVDGRRVGQVQGINTPRGWFSAGTATLRRGVHTVGVVRPGGSLSPGDGAPSSVGAVAFVSTQRTGHVVEVPPNRSASLCGRAWDWIEIVRPSR